VIDCIYGYIIFILFMIYGVMYCVGVGGYIIASVYGGGVMGIELLL